MSWVHQVRVRYGECDMQRVVFNANYLAYCDDAVEQWLRAKGVEVGSADWDFMLKKATIEWHGTATVHETLDIGVEATRWGNTSFDVTFVGDVARRAVFTCVITYVGVTRGTLETAPPPEDVRRALSS